MTGSNYLYYNFQYSNTSDSTQVINFDVTKNVPVLTNCSHYNFSVIKLFIGCRAIPRLYQYILPYGDLNNNYNGNPLQGNPFKSIYAVSLYDSASQTEIIVNLIHTPELGVVPNVPPLTPQAPFQNLVDYANVYQVNSIVNFLTQINTAYATAAAQMALAVPALSGLQPPIITLNNQTGLLTVTAPSANYGATGTVSAGVNFRLRSIVKNFYMKQFGSIFNFVFTDNGATSTASQETPQLDAFSMIRSIVITSDSMNITRYMTDNVGQVGQTFGEQANNLSQAATTGIIASFDLIDNAQGNNLRTAILYSPQAELRRSTFLSNESLSRIQFRVFLQDYSGQLIPYQLEPTESLGMLIMFEKIRDDD